MINAAHDVCAAFFAVEEGAWGLLDCYGIIGLLWGLLIVMGIIGLLWEILDCYGIIDCHGDYWIVMGNIGLLWDLSNYHVRLSGLGVGKMNDHPTAKIEDNYWFFSGFYSFLFKKWASVSLGGYRTPNKWEERGC